MSRFNLPVLRGTPPLSAADLVRLSLHAEEIYCAALSSRASFEFGLALLADDLPDMHTANHVRDIALPNGLSAAQVVAAVAATFAQRQLTCYEWSFADGAVPAPLVGPLEAAGHTRVAEALWTLCQPADLPARADLMVIPGRASFAKLRELAEDAERAWGETRPHWLAQYASCAERHLDDPQVDSLLALDGDRPVGTVSIVLAGQIGFLVELYVHPRHLRRHVGATLLSRAIELAARSRVRALTLFCDEGNTPAERLYERAGFIRAGRIETMRLKG
jgi:ribosomal protein S18 acetylase RimI-like enzyme